MKPKTPPSALLWYYFQNDQVVGPISFDDLRALNQSSSLGDETPVIPEGETDWLALGSIIPPIRNSPPPIRETVQPLSQNRSLRKNQAGYRPSGAFRVRQGCLMVFLGVVALCGGAIIIGQIFGRASSVANRVELMETLEGRSLVFAKEAGFENASIEIAPQADDMKRVKITFNYPDSYSKESSKRATYLEICSFFKKAKSEGGFEKVSSFWFSPVAKLSDKYGDANTAPVGKLVLEKASFERMDWTTPFMERVEKLFAEDGTLEWHPATE